MQPVKHWSLEQTMSTFKSKTYFTAYQGLELQKHQADLDRYRAVVGGTGPDLIIETGTRFGASARWFHGEMGLEVVTIDVRPQVRPGFDRAGLKSVRGSSISDWVFETLLKEIRGKRVMVSLDSDHHSAHVQAEIDRLGSLVSPGCYMVVEDACFDLFDRAGHPASARIGGGRIPEYGGPLDAIEKKLEPNLSWSRDTDIESTHPISHSPCGWWRRRD